MIRYPMGLIFAFVLIWPCVSAAAPDLPAEVAAAARAAMPQMTITDAERKEREGRVYYDVEGTLPNGGEIELDLLQTPGGWTVVEIQRDLPWSAAPQSVRQAAAERWRGGDPVRVIESRQTDQSVVYELFAAGQPATPALEVRLHDGAASVLSEAWPH